MKNTLRRWGPALVAVLVGYVAVATLWPGGDDGHRTVEPSAAKPAIEPATAPVSLAAGDRPVRAGGAREFEEGRSRTQAADPSPSGQRSRVANVPSDADAGTLVVGRVTVRGGASASGGVRMDRGGERLALVSLDADGRFAAGPFGPGPLVIEARSWQCRAATERIELAVGERRRRVDLEVEPLQVLDVYAVDPEGAPVQRLLRELFGPNPTESLRVVATRERPGATLAESGPNLGEFGSAMASYGEPDEPSRIGELVVTEPGPVWAALTVDGRVVQSHRVDLDDDAVTFTLERDVLDGAPGTVRAVLVDGATGEPATAEAWIEATWSFDLPDGTPADANGLVELTDVRPGERVFVASSDSGGATRRIVVPEGGFVDLGTVALHAAVNVKGTVHAADGQPLRRRLRWGRVDAATGAIAWIRNAIVESQADGSFWIPGFEPGRWALALVEEELPLAPEPADIVQARSVLVDTSATDVEGVGLVLEPATLVTVHVDDPFARHMRVTAIDSNDVELSSEMHGRQAPGARLRLLPGSYDLVVERGGSEVARRRVDVGSNPFDVTIDL